jgi:dihydrofolate reductase
MKVRVINHMSLDGVIQSPSGPDEDRRGGFDQGGWAVPNNDEVMARVMGEGMAEGGPLLFGRWTYESFSGYWPHQQDNPVTDVLNASRKYVASTTLTDPLPWMNSTLLEGDAAEAVAKLRAQPGGGIGILGSGRLIHSLMRHNLIDEYQLLIHPIVLGSGLRLFPDGGPTSKLQLVDSVITTTGVVIATYRPETPAPGAAS